MEFAGSVREIWRYPVSSLGGERLTAAEFDRAGVAGDRLWGLVDAEIGAVANPDGERRWRPTPEILARTGAGSVQIRVPGGDWLALCSPEATEAASAFLGFPVAVRPHVPYGSDASGSVAPRYKRADIHILTTASMARLAELVSEGVQIDVRRFRPNLLVETPAEVAGFAERAWVGRTVQLGAARLRISEPCTRCSFTALSQGDLAFEPAVLHAISRHGEGGFGVLATVEAVGKVEVGLELRLAG